MKRITLCLGRENTFTPSIKLTFQLNKEAVIGEQQVGFADDDAGCGGRGTGSGCGCRCSQRRVTGRGGWCRHGGLVSAGTGAGGLHSCICSGHRGLGCGAWNWWCSIPFRSSWGGWWVGILSLPTAGGPCCSTQCCSTGTCFLLRAIIYVCGSRGVWLSGGGGGASAGVCWWCLLTCGISWLISCLTGCGIPILISWWCAWGCFCTFGLMLRWHRRGCCGCSCWFGCCCGWCCRCWLHSSGRSWIKPKRIKNMHIHTLTTVL